MTDWSTTSAWFLAHNAKKLAQWSAQSTVCILANSHIQTTQIDAEKENKTYKPAICNLHDTRYYAAMLSIMICNMYLDISRRKQYKLIRLYCYYHSCARSFAYACLNSCSRGTSEKFSFWQCLHLCTACINLYACKPTAPHSLSLVRFFGLALVQI